MLRALGNPQSEPFIKAPADYAVGTEHFFADMRQYLVGVGVLSVSERTPNAYVTEREALSLAKFLNRLLGLPVHAQNALFGYFTDIISELIRIAKGNGTFDKGIMGEWLL